MKIYNSRILFYTKYSFMGASSRYRTYQYIDCLKDLGIKVKISPLFNDQYIIALYNKHYLKMKFIAIKCILNRIIEVMRNNNFDVIVIEKEMIPYFPAIIEWWFTIMKKKFILDYDDAIFHNYNHGYLIKLLYKRKIPYIISISNGVVAGNPYLSNFAKRFNNNTIIIPTSINLSRYDHHQDSNKDQLIVGWIGSPSTSRYIMKILPSLQKVANNFACRINLIGFDEKLLFIELKENINIIKWTYESEPHELTKLDIGIMPLDDTPWEHGKCGLKLLQYMACGIPVVASPIGVNTKIVEENYNGLFANSLQDWYTSLSYLLSNSEERMIMGQNGRKKVEKYYNHKVNIENLLKFYNDCIFYSNNE